MTTYSGEPLVVEAPKLGRRLKEAMDRRGLDSTRKLETASGVDKNTILRWLSGNPAHADVGCVRKVATALGTTAESLLDLPEPGEASAPLPTRYPRELLEQIAELDPTTLANLEETLPRLRAIIEEIRRRESHSEGRRFESL